MQANRGNGRNWIGFVIFFILVFGSQIFPPLSRWLTQATGLPISSGALYAGAVILGMILPAVLGAVGAARRRVERNEAGSPTQLPPPMRADQAPLSAERLPDWARGSQGRQPGLPPGLPPAVGKLPDWLQPNLPSGQAPRLGKPRFEPIIDPRVLTIGLVGLAAFGLLFAFLIALAF